MNIRELSREELIEESFVDLTYALLAESKETKTYPELVEQVQELLDFTDEEMKPRLVQFYTDMNIDGRFLILGENRWGLREWYPVEQIEEESAPTVKARKKKKAKVADDEDFDDIELELEDELEFDDFDDDDTDDDDDDDDEEEVIKPTADVEIIDFDAEDTDDDEDVDVLVEDLDGNIIDEEDDEEEEEEEEDLK
ncbi:DNA-directed RNA polymerase subunit delta [Planococcus salinus]|uniref:Probable DNA-directed RNA polymerase subunit delta n=1 Tax=Planococcus salinus TaxID=1848460 RepID=A0A3M8P9E1_9BACL|nr:DNA-directed RNA polymerase subunit delta [Planococcus salinus]RNF40325.1 DNA-directed RNA polymerase subunit delta [Planococcus salinus]